jgi:hypothetical protein
LTNRLLGNAQATLWWVAAAPWWLVAGVQLAVGAAYLAHQVVSHGWGPNPTSLAANYLLLGAPCNSLPPLADSTTTTTLA